LLKNLFDKRRFIVA